MIVLLLMLAAITADLGRVVRLTIPHEQGIKSAEIQWQSRKVPFVRQAGTWVTVIGMDLDIKPGEHRAIIELTKEDGRSESREMAIKVNDMSYPTTELKVADRFVQLSPANQKRSAGEAEEIRAIYDAVTPEILWEEPFSLPIPGAGGRNFGHRRVFNGEARAPHAGADLRATTGTPIRSTNRGRVVLAKNLFFTGNTVIVDHGLGIYSLYAHLSKIHVKASEMVKNGQVIGLAGATGRVTGPHLHWGVRVQGARVDPFSLIEMGR